MTWVRTVPPEQADGDLARFYEAWQQQMGFVPTMMQATSVLPRTTVRMDDFRRALIFGGSGLGRRREELIAVVVSVLNGCVY